MGTFEDVLEVRRVLVLELLLRVEDFLERVGVDLEAIETNQKKEMALRDSSSQQYHISLDRSLVFCIFICFYVIKRRLVTKC